MTATSNGNGHAPAETPRDLRGLSHYRALALNFLTTRLSRLQQWLDPRRNLDHECGYPSDYIDPQIYRQLFDREAIAARAVEVFPKECWQVTPSIYEDEDPDIVTPWEQALADVCKTLAGQTYHKEEQGSRLVEMMRRADILSGVGSYGVVLLGLDDNLSLDQPATLREPGAAAGGNGVTRKLTFLRVFPEYYCRVIEFEQNEQSPRFGLPLLYAITFGDAHRNEGMVGIATRTVHWSRVVHLVDSNHQPAVNETFGVSRLQPILNRLLDLRKIYGPDAEGYYKNGIAGWSFETHPTTNYEMDKSALKDEWEEATNSLTRIVATEGGTFKPLVTPVADPRPHIEVQIEAICIKLGIPVRIFKGSERGELASSQDDAAWNDRIRERQNNYLTPCVICPIVDRLIALGVLPVPQSPDGYKVWWPDLESQSQAEKATIAAQETTAIAAFFDPTKELWTRLAPTDFWVQVMGKSDEEARQLVENAEAERAKWKAEKEAEAEKQRQLMQEQQEQQQAQQAEEAARQQEQAPKEEEPPPTVNTALASPPHAEPFAPVVNVTMPPQQITIHTPAQAEHPAPVVNLTVPPADVHIDQPAPIVNVTLPEQQPTVVNVASPPVHVQVEPAAVTVQPPAVNVQVEQPAITVEPAAMPAPIVNVTLPDQPTPTVNVTVPEQLAPTVVVNPTPIEVRVEPPSVTVEASQITVEAPTVVNDITVQPAEIKEVNVDVTAKVEQPRTPLTPPAAPKEKIVRIERKSDGSYEGTVEEK